MCRAAAQAGGVLRSSTQLPAKIVSSLSREQTLSVSDSSALTPTMARPDQPQQIKSKVKTITLALPEPDPEEIA